MAAVRFDGPGGLDKLALERRPIPQPRPGQVRVRVHACGVCHRDVLDRKGAFPFIQRGVVPGQCVDGPQRGGTVGTVAKTPWTEVDPGVLGPQRGGRRGGRSRRGRHAAQAGHPRRLPALGLWPVYSVCLRLAWRLTAWTGYMGRPGWPTGALRPVRGVHRWPHHSLPAAVRGGSRLRPNRRH